MKKPLPLILILFPSLCLWGVACHKSNSSSSGTTHVPAIYGQWRWEKTFWTFGPDTGTAYPAPLSTTVLQLNSNGGFSITHDGSALADSTFQLAIKCGGVYNCDTILTFQNRYAQNATQSYYWVFDNYLVSLRGDSLVLTFDGPFTPAGAGSVQWFVPN
jgi:hypothetical protein